MTAHAAEQARAGGRGSDGQGSVGPAPGGPGLEELVRGLIDYAGMFPPARLDLDGALRESARAPRLRRPHVVGADIVVAYDRLRDLTPARAAQAGFGQTTLSACVVGVPTAMMATAVEGILHHNRTYGPHVRVAALEVHGDSFDAAAVGLARDRLGPTRLFLEPTWDAAAWRARQDGLLDLLADLKGTGAPVGLKVRGVGPTAVGNAQLARIVPAVAALPVPFKATQGLHHPVLEARHANALGFLNLAAAVRLAQSVRLPPADLKRLLENGDAAAFGFADGVSWGGHRIDAFALRLARDDLPMAVGSCSLREPDDDLARLFGVPTRASPRTLPA